MNKLTKVFALLLVVALASTTFYVGTQLNSTVSTLGDEQNVSPVDLESSLEFDPLHVSLNGESKLHVNESSVYEAVVSGGSGNFSYLWSVDPVDEKVVFEYSGGTCSFMFVVATIDPYTLTVEVTDLVSGDKAFDSFTVYDPYTLPDLYLEASLANFVCRVKSDGAGWFFVSDGESGKTLFSSTVLLDAIDYALASTTSGNVLLDGVYFDYSLDIPVGVSVIECVDGLTRVFVNEANSQGSPYTISVDTVQSDYYMAQDNMGRFIDDFTSTNVSYTSQQVLDIGGTIEYPAGHYYFDTPIIAWQPATNIRGTTGWMGTGVDNGTVFHTTRAMDTLLNMTGFMSNIYGVGFVGRSDVKNAISMESQDCHVERCGFMSFNSSCITVTKLINKYILNSWVEYVTTASSQAGILISNTEHVWISGNIFAGNLQDDIRTDGTVSNVKIWDNKVGHGNSNQGYNCTFFNANSGTLTGLTSQGNQLKDKENFYSFNAPSTDISLIGEQYNPQSRNGTFVKTTSTITRGQIIGGSVSNINETGVVFDMVSGGYFSIENVAGYNPLKNIAGAVGTEFLDRATNTSNTMGSTSTGTSASYLTSGQTWYTIQTAPADAGTGTKIYAYICGYSTTVNVKVAIYNTANNGTFVVPTTVAVQSDAVSVTAVSKSWVEFTVPSQTLVGGTQYALAIQASGNMNFSSSTGVTNQRFRSTTTYGTFPDNPTMAFTDASQLSMYFTYASSFTLTNNTAYTCYQSPKTLYFSGFTDLSISLNGQTVLGNVTSATLAVKHSDVLIATWSDYGTFAINGQ